MAANISSAPKPEGAELPMAHISPAADSSKHEYYREPSAERKSYFKWWVIVLIVLAAPVGLPLLVSLLAIPFSIIISFLAIIVSIAIAGIGSIIAGAVSLVAVPLVVFTDIASAVFICGLGLMAIGFGICLLILNTKLTNAMYLVIKFLWRKLFRRKAVAAPAPYAGGAQ